MQIYLKIYLHISKSSTFAPTKLMTYTIRIIPLCKHSEWHASVALFHSLPLYLTLYTLHQPHSLQKMTRILHFFASRLAYINKKYYLCGEKWNYSHHKVIGL